MEREEGEPGVLLRRNTTTRTTSITKGDLELRVQPLQAALAAAAVGLKRAEQAVMERCPAGQVVLAMRLLHQVMAVLVMGAPEALEILAVQVAPVLMVARLEMLEDLVQAEYS